MKHLKLFETNSQYEAYKNSDDFVLPNVSYCKYEGAIKYNAMLVTEDESGIPLYFEAIQDSTFSLTKNDCQYSLDNGATWTTLAAGTSTPTVSAGNKIMFKATNPSASSGSGIGTFSCTGKCNVGGNIMSLLYGDDFVGKNEINKEFQFDGLFRNMKIVDASKLILPATTLANGCYSAMFMLCNSLIKAPELPATTLANSCYMGMFEACSSLTTAPELPATTLANGCYHNMFKWCESLISAPKLPATTLADNCYFGMFGGCTRLNEITMLATDISANSCLYNWVEGVASTGTFTKAAAMTSLPTGKSGIPEGWTVIDKV